MPCVLFEIDEKLLLYGHAILKRRVNALRAHQWDSWFLGIRSSLHSTHIHQMLSDIREKMEMSNRAKRAGGVSDRVSMKSWRDVDEWSELSSTIHSSRDSILLTFFCASHRLASLMPLDSCPLLFHRYTEHLFGLIIISLRPSSTKTLGISILNRARGVNGECF